MVEFDANPASNSVEATSQLERAAVSPVSSAVSQPYSSAGLSSPLNHDGLVPSKSLISAVDYGEEHQESADDELHSTAQGAAYGYKKTLSVSVGYDHSAIAMMPPL